MFKRVHTARNENFSGCMVTTSPKIFIIWLEEPRLSVMRNAVTKSDFKSQIKQLVECSINCIFLF